MKKRKTRLLCLLLTLAMALTLCACGGDKASSDPNHIVLEDCTLDYKGAGLTQDSVGGGLFYLLSGIIPYLHENSAIRTRAKAPHPSSGR